MLVARRLEMELQEELIRIERSLWTNDPEVYEATYTPDAIIVFPEVGKISTSVAVDAIRKENRAGRHWAEVGFDDVTTSQLAPHIVLLTYKAIARWNDEETASGTLCATLYINRDSAWRVAFHQQTPS
jgi:hypothetical protein